jgi:hypothetical protein
MANERIKISQLTPKGANLASTDLLEISEFDGSGYVTRSITGQEIIDAASGGGGDMLKSVYDPDDTGIVLSASKEMVSVINHTGATVGEGTIVYLKTSSSSSTHPEILLADADTEATSTKTIGAVYEDILDGEVGYVVTSGEVDNLNTGMYNIGDKLWLSQTPGEVTTTPPVQPAHTVFIGTVTRSQGVNGRILYAIQNGYELNELHDVKITSIANNDIIQYDSSTLLWKNESLSTAGIQPTLVSGTSIKTINSTSLLGSGDVSVQPTLVSGTNIKTINGSSVLGSGDLTISGGGGLQGVHALGTIPAGLSYGYIASLTSLTATASFNTNTNAIILAPFIPARNITYTSLKINVTTATASCATRILIYSDSSGLPSTKIFESTSVDCSTIGTKTITITGTLTAGTTYWIGTHANNNCILTGIPVGSALVLGSFIMTGAPINAWNYAYGFGSAPTTLNQAQRTNSSGSIQLIQILP